MKEKFIIITLALFVSTFFNVEAQNYDEYVKTKKSTINFTNSSSNNQKKRTNNISILNSPRFFGKKFKLEEKNKRFELQNQTFNDIEIFSAEIKINFDNNGNVILYTDNTINFSEVDNGEFPIIELIGNYSNINIDDVFLSKPIYFPISENKIVPALEIQYYKNSLSYMAIFNSNYDIIYNQSLSFDKDIITSKANASVFNPDPITSAHTVYGGDYVHNQGATNPVLEAEQKNVEIECRYDGTTYFLENDFVKIVDIASPRWTVATSTNGNFNYTRDITNQGKFQQVNAFYHISEMKKYLNSIGFEDAVNYQINVDADAENGYDNSHFTPSGNQGKLTFGAYTGAEEHVPDAEDAEVLVHEYGHAISNWYSFAGDQPERRCLEEATADYLAVSYSRGIDEYEWEKIFKWDAHNEFWDGRMATSDICYTTDITYFPSDDYYRYSGVWTAPLMDLFELLGKRVTDILVMHTITAYTSNTSIEQAALLMMSMDSTYFDNQNSMTIFNTFKKYCILNDGHLANDDYEMSQIKIINSNAFANGGEMKIDFGYLFTGEIKIYDINGKNIFNKKITSERDFYLSSENLNRGIYLINITSNHYSKTVKVCKY